MVWWASTRQGLEESERSQDFFSSWQISSLGKLGKLSLGCVIFGRENKGDYKCITAEASKFWAAPNDSGCKPQINLSPKSLNLTGVLFNLSLKHQPAHRPPTRVDFQHLLSEVPWGTSYDVQFHNQSLEALSTTLKKHIQCKYTMQTPNHILAEPC